MQFAVRALTLDNRVTRLSLDACDENDVRHQLERRSLRAIEIRTSSFEPRIRPGARSRFSLMLFSEELLALLRAGLGPVEALEALAEKETVASTRALLNRLLRALRDGKRFSTALGDQGSLFPPLYLGLVQSAEDTGGLPLALERYLTYQRRIDAVRNQVISASLYPLILCAVGMLVTLFLVAFVVPRFAAVYDDTGRSLPPLSSALLDVGRFITAHGTSLLAAGFALLLTLGLAGQAYLARFGIMRPLSVLPMIGARIHVYQLSRLYLTLGVLLDAGVPITQALLKLRAVTPLHWRHKLVRVGEQIEAGQPLSAAFEAMQLTTPISARMLRAGEQTGQLGRMLGQSAEFYDGDVARFIERFTRTFEPLLMVVIGLVVGGIVLLLYMPIFDLAGSLQ